MNFQEFQDKYLRPFNGLYHFFDPVKGYIVWRVGTGENVEILHIRAFEKRRGYGRELLKKCLLSLKDNPPYFSLFGFGLGSNNEMAEFYRGLGFNVSIIDGPYKHDKSTFIWQSYEVLCNKHLC